MISSLKIKRFKGLSDIEINSLERVNIFLGKNNSGKSSILHAVHISCLAIQYGNWNTFQPKLEIKDLISDVGQFEISLTYIDGNTSSVQSNVHFAPQLVNRTENRPKSISIIPDVGLSLLRRSHRSPHDIYVKLTNNEYNDITAIEILYALKFYSERNEKDLTPAMFTSLLDELKAFFPDITEFVSSLNEHNVPSLHYTENETPRDILYSGTGLKHFLDVLVKITLSNAKVVCLDEPELGLHPDIQRKFFDYIDRLSVERGIQFFIATHSQVILSFAESFKFFRVLNNNGARSVLNVSRTAIHTTLSDLGIRPSDIFNQDMCLLVEGATEVIFFEHVIRVLYKDDFKKVSVGIIQYGGGAASGITNRTINVSNIVSAQKYILWTHDRDSQPTSRPSLDAARFEKAITRAGMECYIWQKREIEFYFPEVIHVRAQQGNISKVTATKAILNGNQTQKYDVAAAAVTPDPVTVPGGVYLRKLLRNNLTNKNQLDQEVRDLIETKLFTWRDQIIG